MTLQLNVHCKMGTDKIIEWSQKVKHLPYDTKKQQQTPNIFLRIWLTKTRAKNVALDTFYLVMRKK